MRKGTFKPWGYKIDYEKSIAEETKQLAEIDRALEFEWFLPEEYAKQGYDLSLSQLVVIDTTAAGRLGLTPTDVANLAAFLELDVPIAKQAERDWYKRGDAVDKRLSELFSFSSLMTKARLGEVRKGLMSRIARHKRNAVKYGT